jgi:hypothetical protein
MDDYDEDETNIEEQEFHNNVREQIVSIWGPVSFTTIELLWLTSNGGGPRNPSTIDRIALF